MVRSVAVIMWALSLANPKLGDATRKQYATTVQQVCKQHDCDPLTLVAMVEYETRWQAATIGRHGTEEYVGLGQIRLRNYAACKDLKSAACDTRRQALLNPTTNLRTMGTLISRARAYCRRVTGRPALFARWLAVYQGIDAQRGSTCNQRKVNGRWRDQPLHRLSRRVIQRRAELARRAHGRGKARSK